MKQKIEIIGPRVHNVGYRYFLMMAATRAGIQRFYAYNRTVGNNQIAGALVEGEEWQVQEFMDAIRSQKPDAAILKDVSTSEYTGEVRPIGEFANVFTASQMEKAIPLLLKIEQSTMKIEQSSEKIEQSTIRIEQSTMKIEQSTTKIEKSTMKIEGNTNPIPAILGEIKDLGNEIQPGYALQIRQIQEDIRAMKVRLGMP